MKRPLDSVEIRSKAGIFDAFEACDITAALNAPTEAKFKLGDDGAWDRLEQYIRPGYGYQVFINGRSCLAGRVEAGEYAGSADGFAYDLVVRTRLSDARATSADPTITVEKVSIKAFVLKLFARLGFTEADFEFSPAANRDLLTGKSPGAPDPVNLEAIQVQAAKVQPPETIWDCATRHLQRHGLMMWEAVDGRICVGVPDDKQAPLYRFVCKRPDQGANNVVEVKRTRDWREVVRSIEVLGFSPGKDFSKVPIAAKAEDVDVTTVFNETGHFNRVIELPLEKAKNPKQAANIAQRELSARRRKALAWEFSLDGWTYWDGSTTSVVTFNAVADVDVDVAGGPAGPNLIWRVSYKLDKDGTSMTADLCAPGLWTIEGGVG